MRRLRQVAGRLAGHPPLPQARGQASYAAREMTVPCIAPVVALKRPVETPVKAAAKQVTERMKKPATKVIAGFPRDMEVASKIGNLEARSLTKRVAF